MYEKDKTLNGEVDPRTAPDKAAGDRIVQMIVFNLGHEEFGADIDQVREIISKGFVTPIPDSPDFISGMTNVRGEIAVVIDLKNRFLLTSKSGTDEKHIIITEHGKNLFGLMVDEVTEVLRIQMSQIKATPEIVTRIDRVYITGVITLGKRLIMLLDLQKVLSEEELAKLSLTRARNQPAAKLAGEWAEKPAEEEAGTPVRAEKAKPPKPTRRKKIGGMDA